MIVKMKKITLIVSEKYINSALQSLRQLGVVHIKHMIKPSAHHITSLENKISLVEKSLLLKRGETNKNNELINEDELYPMIKEINSLDEKNKRLKHKLGKLQNELEWFDEWGDISKYTLGELKKSGVFIKLYVCNKKDFQSLSNKKLIFVVKEKGNLMFLAFTGISENDKLEIKEVEVPHEGLHSLKKNISAVEAELKDINQRIEKLLGYKYLFVDYKRKLEKTLEFCKVRYGMTHEEEICCLQGFCPNDDLSDIKKCSKKEGWGLVIEDTVDSSDVPTLIRHPRWVKMIQPVFNFMGTIPGYEEYDISSWFLIFFSLFFAMLIGDAGYGVLFLLTTVFVRKKFFKAPSAPFKLMYILASGTIIWGAVTGNWFGFKEIAQLPFFNALVVDKLDSFVDANQMFLMYICLFIGAVQLTVAHGISAFRYINKLYVFSQVGWILIVWGVFFFAGTLILDNPFPMFAKYLLIVGASLVALFSNLQKNIFKGILISIANLPLKLVGSFGDTLSYLRLFAVGYASVMVATSFNEMALTVGFNNVFRGLGAAVILFIGHTLNIVLGFLSVLVHGIRLNMLEFSGHLDMEWAGKEYKPFKE